MKIQQSFGYLVNLCARLIKRRLDGELQRYDITSTQWGVLKLLSQEDNLSQAEIAERANVDRATMGAVIDKLITKGHVEKELSRKDRRSYIVRILPSAVKGVEEVAALAEDINSLALRGLSEDQAEIFAKCLRIVISNLGDGDNVEV